MATKRASIQAKAIEILKETPKGLRWTELQKQLQREFPSIPPNTIQGSTWNLDVTHGDKVYKPSRGLWKFKGFESEEEIPATPTTLGEEAFYQPFADWIKTELGECTDAVVLGGHSMNKKWGTPDVVGTYRAKKRDIIQFNTEILSAEIKISPSDPITAFGQAIAYRLFSTKVYIVEPNTIAPADRDRLEALCLLFGVGLVLFDVDVRKPNFSILTRAQKFTPDMFWANEFADKLYAVDKESFDKLFG